jgi:hypothetical protein
MATEERIAAMERTLEGQAVEHTAMKTTLEQILERLNDIATHRDDEDEDRCAQEPPPSAPPSPTRRRAKPSPPSDFHGERSQGRAFINSCRLYFSLTPDAFRNDQERIKWVLTFFKSGRAASFADRLLRYEERRKRPRYIDYTSFEERLIADFCPANERLEAIMRLESSRYFQGKRDVEAYIDEFQELVDWSGYSEPIAIVMKFRRGLSPKIQNKIAESGRDKPADDDTEGWYETARLLDVNRVANEEFNSSWVKPALPLFRTAPTTSRMPIPLRAVPTPPVPTIASHTSPRQPPPQPPRQLPIKSEIDRTRAQPTPRPCFRCGDLNHLARDCPHALDIRYMTIDERRAWVEEELVEMDVATEEPEATEEQEDF